jgi:hypothetical protein
VVVRTIGAVASVSAVHEEMHDQAEQQEPVRQRTQDVRFVLVPQEERGDRQENAEAQPHGKAPGLASRLDRSHAALAGVEISIFNMTGLSK